MLWDVERRWLSCWSFLRLGTGLLLVTPLSPVVLLPRDPFLNKEFRIKSSWDISSESSILLLRRTTEFFLTNDLRKSSGGIPESSVVSLLRRVLLVIDCTWHPISSSPVTIPCTWEASHALSKDKKCKFMYNILLWAKIQHITLPTYYWKSCAWEYMDNAFSINNLARILGVVLDTILWSHRVVRVDPLRLWYLWLYQIEFPSNLAFL